MTIAYATPGRVLATSGDPQGGKYLVVAGGVFNLWLCFVATRGWLHVGNAQIAAVELTIMAVGFYMIRNRIDRNAIWIMAVTCGFLAGAKLVNPAISFKILHDFGIMYIFYQLGRMASERTARSTIRILMVLVLAVGFVELVFTQAFAQAFNIWDYYVQKGVISSDTVNYSNTNLFLSGNRGAGAGRTFFESVFGPHRVSSIFLEPDSLGNFSAVVFAWCLSVSKNRPGRRCVMLYILAALCFVLADSRFASGCCALMLMLRLTPLCRVALVTFLLPLLVATALTLVGSFHELPGVLPAILKDDLSGRLVFSGRLLDYWHVGQWFGMAPSQVYTSDTGYAYVLNNLGAILTLFYLGLFAFRPPRSREGEIMRAMMSVYFATSLCIGASVFTIKTAALLWFLYGTTEAGPAAPDGASARRRPAARRPVMSAMTEIAA
ncbi:surface polysaccharide polymerase [Gluconacetobacter johannae DSM 13595]|uniref:polysaccharide polymerase n=1 Tax=Gluconacetobacter johannae TaxID=112140 RepID=UPI001FE46661|nr:polysaccharide polymerase [Gluconacetobacter johannae]GBQ87323.1 surface polysaccharide polymerase [Gluconacetobacter johannae DSM 13595]